MRKMRSFVLVGLTMAATAVASAMVWSKRSKNEIVGSRPDMVAQLMPKD